MILPTKAEVRDKFKYGKSSTGERKILHYCRKNDILVFNSIEALAKQAKSVNEIQLFFFSHTSAKGNKVIAQYLYDFLKNSVLKGD